MEVRGESLHPSLQGLELVLIVSAPLSRHVLSLLFFDLSSLGYNKNHLSLIFIQLMAKD